MPQTGGQGWRGVAIGTIAASACVFAIVGWNSTSKLNTLWDERVDLDIATSLARAPIRGEATALDPTQFRLPMYATATAFAASGRDDLATARAVSLGVGVLGIVLAGGLAWRLFGAATAAWTAILLAFSPYYLAYGRIAMTEGDVFLATTVTGACWAFAAFVERPTSGRWLLAGIALGLAVGAKAFAIVLIPAFMLCMPAIAARPAPARGLRGALWLAAVVAILALGGTITRFVDGVGAWVAFLLAFVVVVLAAMLTDAAALGRWNAMAGIVVVAGLTWGAVMPEHVTRPEILRGLISRGASWDHLAPLALLGDHLRLYSGVVLVKATWPIGVLSIGGVICGLIRARNDWRSRLTAGTVVLWIAALCTLPLRQAFYLMGVYPLLLMIAAAMGAALVGRIGRYGTAAGGMALLAIAVAPTVWLAVRTAQAYPDYQMFPDDSIRSRWMGAEARGYRNLIQTNSDGVEDVVGWCLANVPAGSRVVSYLWEDSIIDRLMRKTPAFELIRRGISQASDAVPPPPDIAGADYILMHINNILGYGDRPPDAPDAAALQLGFEPVFVIRRGQTRMPVAWVYKRRELNIRPMGSDPAKMSR